MNIELFLKLCNFFKIEPKKFFDFGLVMDCDTDKDKMNSIIEMLESTNSETNDILYKITKSLIQ